MSVPEDVRRRFSTMFISHPPFAYEGTDATLDPAMCGLRMPHATPNTCGSTQNRDVSYPDYNEWNSNGHSACQSWPEYRDYPSIVPRSMLNHNYPDTQPSYRQSKPESLSIDIHGPMHIDFINGTASVPELTPDHNLDGIDSEVETPDDKPATSGSLVRVKPQDKPATSESLVRVRSQVRIKCPECHDKPRWIFMDELDNGEHVMHMRRVLRPCKESRLLSESGRAQRST